LAFSFDFVIGSDPNTILLTAGSNATYANLTLQPLPAASSGSETVALSSTAPPGLALTLSTNSVMLTTDAKAFVGMTITSSQSMTPGDYKVTVGATYGTSSKTSDITVRVVQYLILGQGNAYTPSTFTVNQGSTVYWINLDSPGGPGGDPEIHSVVFSSGSSAHSADLAQYDSYSYTFTTPGTYAYYCGFHPSSMHGTITVTSG
jgi:plastocyanin